MTITRFILAVKGHFCLDFPHFLSEAKKRELWSVGWTRWYGGARGAGAKAKTRCHRPKRGNGTPARQKIAARLSRRDWPAPPVSTSGPATPPQNTRWPSPAPPGCASARKPVHPLRMPPHTVRKRGESRARFSLAWSFSNCCGIRLYDCAIKHFPAPGFRRKEASNLFTPNPREPMKTSTLSHNEMPATPRQTGQSWYNWKLHSRTRYASVWRRDAPVWNAKHNCPSRGRRAISSGQSNVLS